MVIFHSYVSLPEGIPKFVNTGIIQNRQWQRLFVLCAHKCHVHGCPIAASFLVFFLPWSAASKLIIQLVTKACHRLHEFLYDGGGHFGDTSSVLIFSKIKISSSGIHIISDVKSLTKHIHISFIYTYILK